MSSSPVVFLGLKHSSDFLTSEGVAREQLNLVLDVLTNFKQSKAVLTGVSMFLAIFSLKDIKKADKVFIGLFALVGMFECPGELNSFIL